MQDPVRRERALSFEAEVYDNTAVDIQITLELSERVIVHSTPAGYECEHLPEPQLPDLSGPTGWEIYLKGELISAGHG